MEILTQSPENSAQIGLAPNSGVEEVGDVGKDAESGSVERNSKGGLYPVQHPPSSQQQPLDPAEGRKIAFFIPCIVALNVGMFVVIMYTNDCPKTIPTNRTCFAKFLQRFSFQPLSENPLLGPSSQTLERLGALDAHKVTHDHQGWRLITCIWLHAGVVHVLANMLSLLFIGIRLEQEFRFGALFGLLGAMLSEIIMNWTIYTNKCATITTLVLVVAVNLAMGILPHVDNFAHIGGFIVGFLSGFVLLVKPQFGWVNRASLPPGYDMESLTKAKYQAHQYALWVIALVFLIAGIVTVTVLVLRGVKECTWCHYLSCVPTSKWKCNDSSSSLSCSVSVFKTLLPLACPLLDRVPLLVGQHYIHVTLLWRPSETETSLCYVSKREGGRTYVPYLGQVILLTGNIGCHCQLNSKATKLKLGL